MEQKRPAARVQQGFLHGAFILMFGVLLVKAIGALFKIPLSSIITEDGMGYFSTAYSFFNVLFSLSTVGFPVAVARLTAAEDALGHFRDVRQIKAAALPVFSVIGVLCALLMASFAPLYTRLVQNPGALFSMLALAPCAALCSIPPCTAVILRVCAICCLRRVRRLRNRSASLFSGFPARFL